MVKHVIPALARGRRVYARMDGLNYEKIAELAGITLERCQELLIHVPEDDVLNVFKLLAGVVDALVVIDEIQNYWPKGRASLPDDIMKGIAEHGHHGLDFVIMGQDFTDVHSAWIKRTERKLMFLKLTAIGQENRYHWTAYSAIKNKDGRPPKWAKSADGITKYDSTYFGTYKSHVDGVENKGAYSDSRFVIWNRPMMKYGMPAVLIGFIAGVWWLVDVFQTPDAFLNTKEPEKKTVVQTAPAGAFSGAAPTAQSSQPARPTQNAVPVPEKRVPKAVQDDYFYKSLQRANPTLTYVQRLNDRILDVLVEMRDSNDETIESWTMEDIISQGWSLKYRTFGIEAKKAGFVVLLRERPTVYLASATSVVSVANPIQ